MKLQISPFAHVQTCTDGLYWKPAIMVSFGGERLQTPGDNLDCNKSFINKVELNADIANSANILSSRLSVVHECVISLWCFFRRISVPEAPQIT